MLIFQACRFCHVKRRGCSAQLLQAWGREDKNLANVGCTVVLLPAETAALSNR